MLLRRGPCRGQPRQRGSRLGRPGARQERARGRPGQRRPRLGGRPARRQQRRRSTAVVNAPLLPGDYISTGAARRAPSCSSTAKPPFGSAATCRRAITNNDPNNRALQLADGTIEVGLVHDASSVPSRHAVGERALAGDGRLSHLDRQGRLDVGNGPPRQRRGDHAAAQLRPAVRARRWSRAARPRTRRSATRRRSASTRSTSSTRSATRRWSRRSTRART